MKVDIANRIICKEPLSQENIMKNETGNNKKNQCDLIL